MRDLARGLQGKKVDRFVMLRMTRDDGVGMDAAHGARQTKLILIGFVYSLGLECETYFMPMAG